MTATFKSNLPQFLRDHQKASDLALVRGAMVYQEVVRERLARGYTTGLDTSGKAAENVVIAAPVTEDGVRVVRVGHTWEGALQWEVGYVDELTQEFRRIPIWRPLAVQNAQRIGSTFTATYQSNMAKWRTA